MAERQIQDVALKFASTGVVTKAGSDSLPDSAWASLVNVVIDEEGVISSRRGIHKWLANFPSTTYSVHSIAELFDEDGTHWIIVVDRSGQVYKKNVATGGWTAIGTPVVGEYLPSDWPANYNGIAAPSGYQVTLADYIQYMDPRVSTATISVEGRDLSYVSILADGWRMTGVGSGDAAVGISMPHPTGGIASISPFTPAAQPLSYLNIGGRMEYPNRAPGATGTAWAGCHSYPQQALEGESVHPAEWWYVSIAPVFQSAAGENIIGFATEPRPMWIHRGEALKVYKYRDSYPPRFMASANGNKWTKNYAATANRSDIWTTANADKESWDQIGWDFFQGSKLYNPPGFDMSSVTIDQDAEFWASDNRSAGIDASSTAIYMRSPGNSVWTPRRRPYKDAGQPTITGAPIAHRYDLNWANSDGTAYVKDPSSSYGLAEVGYIINSATAASATVWQNGPVIDDQSPLTERDIVVRTGALSSISVRWTDFGEEEDTAEYHSTPGFQAIYAFKNVVTTPLLKDAKWEWTSGNGTDDISPKQFTDGWDNATYTVQNDNKKWVKTKYVTDVVIVEEVSRIKQEFIRTPLQHGMSQYGSNGETPSMLCVTWLCRAGFEDAAAESVWQNVGVDPATTEWVVTRLCNVVTQDAERIPSSADASYTTVGVGAQLTGGGAQYIPYTLQQLCFIAREERASATMSPAVFDTSSAYYPSGATGTAIGWVAYAGMSPGSMSSVMSSGGYFPIGQESYILNSLDDTGAGTPTNVNYIGSVTFSNGTWTIPVLAKPASVLGNQEVSFVFRRLQNDSVWNYGSVDDGSSFTFYWTAPQGRVISGTVKFIYNSNNTIFTSGQAAASCATYYSAPLSASPISKDKFRASDGSVTDKWDNIQAVQLSFQVEAGTVILFTGGSYTPVGQMTGAGLSYGYSFYNTSSGFESDIWYDPNKTIVANKSDVVLYFGAEPAVNMASADVLRIYRIGAGLDALYLVDEIPLDQNVPSPYATAAAATADGVYPVGVESGGANPHSNNSTPTDVSKDPWGPAWTSPTASTPRALLEAGSFWYADKKGNHLLITSPTYDLDAGPPPQAARGVAVWQDRLWTWGGYESVTDSTGKYEGSYIEPQNKLRWSYANNPSRFGQSSYLYVGETNDKIQNMVVWDGELFVCTTGGVYRIVNSGDSYMAQSTSSRIGMMGRMSYCLSDSGAFARGYDGIYTFPNGQKITEPVETLFLGPATGQAGLYPVENAGDVGMGWQFECMAAYNGRLYWSYRSKNGLDRSTTANDANGNWNDSTLVYDIEAGRVESMWPVGFDCLYTSLPLGKIVGVTARQKYSVAPLPKRLTATTTEAATIAESVAKTSLLQLETGFEDEWDGTAPASGYFPVPAFVVTGDLDFGAPDEEKQVIDFVLDLDNNGNPVYPSIRKDGSESDPFGTKATSTLDGNPFKALNGISGSLYRKHVHLETEGLADVQTADGMHQPDSDATFTVRRLALGLYLSNQLALGNVWTNNRPVRLYSAAVRLLPEPARHKSFRTGWEHGGSEGDKYWTNFWLEYNDLGTAPSSITVKVRKSDCTEQTFTVTDNLGTGGKRTRRYFPIGVDVSGELAMMTVNLPSGAAEVKVYDYGWVTQPKATAMQVSQTEWTDCGYPHRKMFKHVDLDLNTQGEEVTINIWVDGVVVDTFNAMTPAGETGRRQVLHSLPEETFGKLIRLTTDDPDGVEMYAPPNWEFDTRNPDVTLADAYEQTLNYNGKKVLRKIFYCVENPNAPVTLDIFVDNVLRHTATIPDNGPGAPADQVHPNEGGTYAPDGVHPAYGPYPKFGIRLMDLPPYLKGKVFRFRFSSAKAFEIDLEKTEIYVSDNNQGYPLRTPELPHPNNA